MVTQPGSDFNLPPGYPQLATVRCYHCNESITRTMTEMISMLSVDGYATCSQTCRDDMQQEMLELLILHGGAIS